MKTRNWSSTAEITWMLEQAELSRRSMLQGAGSALGLKISRLSGEVAGTSIGIDLVLERAELSRRAMTRKAGRALGRCICDLPEKLGRRGDHRPQNGNGPVPTYA